MSDLKVRELFEKFIIDCEKITGDHPVKINLPRGLYFRLCSEIIPDSNFFGSSGTWMTVVGPIELVRS